MCGRSGEEAMSTREIIEEILAGVAFVLCVGILCFM
jgi:hypothetical protein